jgi:hypothetical protein
MGSLCDNDKTRQDKTRPLRPGLALTLSAPSCGSTRGRQGQSCVLPMEKRGQIHGAPGPDSNRLAWPMLLCPLPLSYILLPLLQFKLDRDHAKDVARSMLAKRKARTLLASASPRPCRSQPALGRATEAEQPPFRELSGAVWVGG